MGTVLDPAYLSRRAARLHGASDLHTESQVSKPKPVASLAHRDHLASLDVKDFKSLKEVHVLLGQVNVFIGANGSGKSNLLEAIGILGSAAAGIVDDQALLRRGVRPGVLFKSSFKSQPVAPKISLRATSNAGAEYHAYITKPADSPSPTWLFGNETLKLEKTRIASRGPRGNATIEALSLPLEMNRSVANLARTNKHTPERMRAFLAVLDDFAIFAPVTPVLRGLAPDPAPRLPVGLFGGQLPEAVGLLRPAGKQADPLAGALELIDWARHFEMGPPSQEILSASVPTTRYVLRFTDRFMANGRDVLSGYDASEGALYVLFMLVLAVHENSPRSFAIDNFDQALNPRTARALTSRFVEAALEHDRQAFLTTHNPLVLDGLPLDDDRVRLFTVGRSPKGFTAVKRVPVKNLGALKQKHGEFALSRLWVTGLLGGMPDV